MPQQQNERNIFFLYQLGHIDACARFLDENSQIQKEGYLVIPLGLEIEHALAKKGIPFRSGRAYRPSDTSRFQLSEEWAEVLDGQEWAWFQYRDVALSKAFFFSIRQYALHILYYATILQNLLVRHPTTRRLIVFPSLHSVPATSSKKTALVRGQPLLNRYLAGVTACAELIGTQRGIEVIIPRIPTQTTQTDFTWFVFSLKRAFLELGIHIYNLGMGLLRSRGIPRILASDHWRNIAPIMSQLPQGELMLFDRGEIAKVGIRNLWRSRVRLFNFNSFSIRDREKDRAETQRLFVERWRDLRTKGFPEFAVGGISLSPLFVEAFEELCTQVVPQTLRDIDGAYAMLNALAPDVVFLRATVSLQTHFYILAQAARALGIPSLELEHGLEYLGPGSNSKRRGAEYTAVYGQLVQDEFVTLGFPREKVPIVGSPRFDAYAKETSRAHQDGPERKGLSVLCVGSFVSMESAQDEYDLEDYYSAIARALEKIPNSSVVIKLRPGPARENYYRELINRIFARVPHTIAQYESLPELFASADIVVSYYSTFVLEALQFNKPTIVFSVEPREEAMIRFHFTRYAEAGGLLTAYSQDELEEAFCSLSSDITLRNRLAQGAKKILAQFFLFEGNASERTIELVKRLARNTRGSDRA